MGTERSFLLQIGWKRTASSLMAASYGQYQARFRVAKYTITFVKLRRASLTFIARHLSTNLFLRRFSTLQLNEAARRDNNE